jgi:hypothetical protein
VIDLSTAARPRVALLVDGENLSDAHAETLLAAAQGEGNPIIRRVYGDVGRISRWAELGFRLIHSGTGKNAADLLLTVEAMALMLGGRADVLVIASSDSDFSHLATHLCEAGIRVVGLGEEKTRDGYRKTCSQFTELRSAAGPTAPAATQNPPAAASPAPEAPLHKKVRKLIADEGENGAMPIVRLGGRMGALHKVRISDHEWKTWRAFLLAHPSLFRCDARGPDARVHLRS